MVVGSQNPCSDNALLCGRAQKRQPARSADGADEVVNQARYECGLAGLAQPCDSNAQSAIMQERRQCRQFFAPAHPQGRQITVIVSSGSDLSDDLRSAHLTDIEAAREMNKSCIGHLPITLLSDRCDQVGEIILA